MRLIALRLAALLCFAFLTLGTLAVALGLTLTVLAFLLLAALVNLALCFAQQT